MLAVMGIVAVGLLVLVACFAFVEDINDDEDDFY